MLDLLTGGNGTLAVIGGVIVAVLAVIWKALRTGRALERGKAAEAAKKGWVEADEFIGTAQGARRISRMRDGADLMSDDGHKRPSD